MGVDDGPQETQAMLTRSVTAVADDRKAGLTLGQVAAWVQDAYRAEIEPDAPVKVATGWRSQIVRLEVTG